MNLVSASGFIIKHFNCTTMSISSYEYKQYGIDYPYIGFSKEGETFVKNYTIKDKVIPVKSVALKWDAPGYIHDVGDDFVKSAIAHGCNSMTIVIVQSHPMYKSGETQDDHQLMTSYGDFKFTSNGAMKQKRRVTVSFKLFDGEWINAPKVLEGETACDIDAFVSVTNDGTINMVAGKYG